MESTIIADKLRKRGYFVRNDKYSITAIGKALSVHLMPKNSKLVLNYDEDAIPVYVYKYSITIAKLNTEKTVIKLFSLDSDEPIAELNTAEETVEWILTDASRKVCETNWCFKHGRECIA
ncbi:hypothetical protein HNP86_001911 [Methanococcus maripaludis]|uniref:Uncharacterized protein n=1 Tax=Methanococcus maripaludis TaxID=39152 RepID=A0A7J9NVP2_METMI|nr:hypothetical protein [Methanococcus maripaludis]MBA2851752.1 hypothetical protein [Methanococcus maripaludis]